MPMSSADNFLPEYLHFISQLECVKKYFEIIIFIEISWECWLKILYLFLSYKGKYEEWIWVYYQFNILIISSSKSIEIKGFYRFFFQQNSLLLRRLYLYSLFVMRTAMNSWASIYNIASLDLSLININIRKTFNYIKWLSYYM